MAVPTTYREVKRSQRPGQGARFVSDSNTIEIRIIDIGGKGTHRRAQFEVEGVPNKDYMEVAPESGLKEVVDGIELQARVVHRDRGRNICLTYYVPRTYALYWID